MIYAFMTYHTFITRVIGREQVQRSFAVWEAENASWPLSVGLAARVSFYILILMSVTCVYVVIRPLRVLGMHLLSGKGRNHGFRVWPKKAKL